MKSAFLNGAGGTEQIKVGELPDARDPKPNEVKVKVRFAALNHLDVWVRKGLAGVKLNYPHIFCGDASGTVESVGEDVCDFKVGDEVVVHPGNSCLKCPFCLSGQESLCSKYQILGEHISGTAAEWVTVSQASVFPKPKSLTWEEAASVPLAFTTAWQMIYQKARVQPSETVLVHAAGSGVSTAAIQMAKLCGASVITTVGSVDKAEKAKKIGADEVILYREKDFSEEVKRLTNNQGVDAVIDHVGVETWKKNIKSLRWGGRLVSCGATSGFEAQLDLRQLFYKQLQFLGSTMGSRGDFPAILKLLANKKISAVVDKVFPLEEIKEAQSYLESRKPFGKIVIKI